MPEKKKRKGRPVEKDARREFIGVRVSKEELKLLEKGAMLRDKTLSEFIRDEAAKEAERIIGGTVVPP